MGQGHHIRLRAKGAAEILIYEDVGASWFGGITAKDFAEQLKALGTIQTIDVRINSYGGDVFDGLAIYNQLVTHKAKVTTHIDGVAASIASVIAMAGNEIRMAEAGHVMIHDAWGVALGNARELRDFAERLDAVTASLGDVYAARTRVAQAQLRAWMAAETWFTSAEAMTHGFATSIVENMRAAAKYDPARYRFKHPPSQLSGRPDYESARLRIADQRARMARRSLKRRASG